MGRGAAGDKEEQPVDKRIQWCEARINASLRLRGGKSGDQMKKFLDNEDNQNGFREFLEVSDAKHLFVYQNTAKLWVARVEPPDQLVGKGVFFTKLIHPSKITDPDKMKDQVGFGDITPDLLASLNTLTTKFFLPLISNSDNLGSVPEVCRGEFMDVTHTFKSQLLVTLGLSQDKTLLPIPPVPLPAKIGDTLPEKEVVYQMENAMVAWSAQIKQAMQSSPEEMLEAAEHTHVHPGPQQEILFWKKKTENLDFLEEQLYSPKVLKIILLLKKAKSSYYKGFEALVEDLKVCAKEARSNYRFLRPLEQEFMALSSGNTELPELMNQGTFKRLFHFLWLLWTNSTYNTPARLVVLIREMCNDLIDRAREYVAVQELWNDETAITKLSTTLSVCGNFKAAYFSYKSKCAKTASPWKFQNTALFSRLDCFLERCHDLLDLLETSALFQRMETMKIGGTSGCDMTTTAEDVRASFNKAFLEFQSVEYDLLNVDEPQFDADYGTLRSIIRNLEMRMGTMLSASIDESRSFLNLFKAVDTFDGFTDRAIVAQDWAKKQMDVLEAYHEDLLTVQELFNKNKDLVASYPNMPPTATSLIWGRALFERINSEPYARLTGDGKTVAADDGGRLSKAVLQSELGQETVKLYQTLSAQIKAYIHQAYDAWATAVGGISSEKLKLNLLVKDDEGRLAVNFDPQLVKTLREVSYLELLNSFETSDESGTFQIPPQANALHKQQETFRTQVLSLEFVTKTYNDFIESMSTVECERPLLRQELDLFDAEMAKGLRELQWNSEAAIDEFIAGALKSVKDIDNVVANMHGNLQQMVDLIQDFVKDDKWLPLRAGQDKTMPETEFRKKLDENNKQRKAALQSIGVQIHDLLDNTLKTINDLKQSSGFPVLDNDTDVWCTYVEHVNKVVQKEVCASVVNSLQHLHDQLDSDWLKPDAGHDGMPLLELKLILTKPKDPAEAAEVRFEPHLVNKEGITSSVEQLVNEVISNINTTATYITKLYPLDGAGEGTDNYLSDVLQDPDANRLVKQIHELLAQNADRCSRFVAGFDEFRQLYETDMRAEFKKFTGDDKEGEAGAEGEAAKGDHDEVGEYFGVPLKNYDAAITEYEKTAERIQLIEERQVIGFIKIDVKPLKHAFNDVCRRWREMYSGHLTKKIEDDLTNLQKFIEEADAGLKEEVLDGNIESLKSVMRHIRDCRKKHVQVMGNGEKAVGMFPPIIDAIQMLKGHPLTDHESETLERLDEMRKPAPEQWNTLYKLSLNVQSQNSQVQDKEAEKIKTQEVEFETRVAKMAEEFRKTDLFSYELEYTSVYDRVDTQNREFKKVADEAEQLRNLQDLFDLTQSDFPKLKTCREDLRLLKSIWDLVTHVKMNFSDWMKSSFKNVDVDSFLEEIKKIKTQFKAVPPKAKKDWQVWLGLELEVKNMATALPLCAELRSPAMRDRHWQQLLTATKYTGPAIDPDAEEFTLEKLIGMGLHKYEEEVGNIVEKATKELSIEKALLKIIAAWDKMAVSYEYQEAHDTYLLGSIDEIVEQYEADNNTLQGMLANRFVEHFLEKVNLWSHNLGMVETCITKWIEIQRKWISLFPIFVGSADIKEQLPERAKDFQECDTVFRQLMSHAHKYTNVIEVLVSDVMKNAMNRDQELEDTLDFMMDILVRCEKALSEYLETKRQIFPRFYFVSSQDLIEILSKGSIPEAVLVHMSKIVDSIETFQIEGNPRPGAGPKDAFRIVSVQGEQVDLEEDFTCDGPVEEWLNGCITSMQKAIRHHIQAAWSGSSEKTRVEWVYAYICQAIIVASRIYYTHEVHQAFAQLEDGTESGMKDLAKNQHSQLRTLIEQVLREDLTGNQRKMLVHLITIDVHNRDIVDQMVLEKVDAVDAFQWQSQLRYYWDEKRGSEVRICDAEFINNYEYIGLCGCLVITKLTDRCYITLSQALRLKKGGAPAGPAGTGKTETTKDLARNLGIACYVFNCSDQMDFRSLGSIFKGLAMSGSWGCFDEFNRISIEVLSVVATQVGSILNGLKEKASRFDFMGENIPLIPTVGMWITMNPGYAGRTELPENIKSLFRPCAMCVPDLKNICEIMLAAEGFGDAQDLALKFVTLYRLNKELLSPARHYDWGLRAVKSVLYIAGALKRADKDTSERIVLMRALRDTNMAKLSKDDLQVFRGLISALFPRMDPPKKEKPELVAACKEVCKETGLLTGNGYGDADIFVTKCVQYEELLHVRHSVFVLGPAGAGKTSCITTLKLSLHKLGDKCQTKNLNPKAITSNELYGYFLPSKEWKDGILSSIFRDFARESKEKKNSKWIVLDGIIDAEWIESMNTVMDDNKMLTLVSNERITLTGSMRMIFEISHLLNASPATVSRAGVVYINETDIGWQPFKERWINNREDEREASALDGFFDKYVLPVFEYWKRAMKPIVSLVDLAVVQTICFMLEGMLTESLLPKGGAAAQLTEIYEKVFVFCTVWAFGGPLPAGTEGGRHDQRVGFTNFWRKEFPHMKMSDNAMTTVFDFFLDTQDYEWKKWDTLVEPFTFDPESGESVAASTVQTADMVRMTYIMSLFLDRGKPVMLVGVSGTGKTNLIMHKLKKLDNTQTIFRVVAFNARTNSLGLQSVIEANLEKRGGRTFGPPNRKKLIFFFDDMNMPEPDKYGTQEAIALIQQHWGYKIMYDRTKIAPPKEIQDLQYVAAMNPKSGTFTILDRLLRHFAVFATSVPDRGDLCLIYGQILKAHLSKFSHNIRENFCTTLTNATIDLHAAVAKAFLPTAVKFVYAWNMRELYNIFQGLTRSNVKLHNDPVALGRLWIHECTRTFRDRMPDTVDMDKFDEILAQTAKSMPDVDQAEMQRKPNMWGPFTTTKDGEEGVYDETSEEVSEKFLYAKLAEYNEVFARMDLVLFGQAIEHVCRICRITNNPRGNALLVGVGGSGKQSLARLASFVNGQDVFQILVTSSYGIADFRADVQGIYNKAGLKGNPYAFIITDSQIVKDDMLVYMNDMLSSGNVPELFNQEERDNIIGSITNEVKASGHPDYSNADVCWEFFIKKVRSNLHIILCFSPVGLQFAKWCRQFPALANTTVIDWFHPWPEDALKKVAKKFLMEVELGGEEMTQNIADFMALSQGVIVDSADDFYRVEKRRCYTTPKSFLELINMYKVLLGKKRQDLDEKKNRLETGIEKIREAGAQVADLQEKLKKDQVEVEIAKKNTDVLMEEVGREKAIVQEENEKAEIEEAKVTKVRIEAEALAESAQRDVDAAQPLVDKAKAALDTLDKNSLTELKSMGKPPDDVVMVACAVMVLMTPPGKPPAPMKNRNWGEAKKMMAQVTTWLKQLQDFDAENIPQPNIDAIDMYVSNPAFDSTAIATKSAAASGLCAWVRGMNDYHKVMLEVKPKRAMAAEAKERLEGANAQLQKVQNRVAQLKAQLEVLMKKYNDAVDAANEIAAKAKKTQDKADLAQRLVGGLADENVRWAATIDDLTEQRRLLVGDVLLASAFVSYIGPFSKAFREKILVDSWTPAVKQLGIPMTPGLDVVNGVLTSPAIAASWNNEGLPSDPVSIENGSIVTNCSRWPLMIDPQLQGVKWIRNREEKNGLKVIMTGQKEKGRKWTDTLAMCIEEGLPCLLASLQEHIEPILDNVLGRVTFKKAGKLYVRLGATDVEYNPKFRFYLQTKLSNPHYKPEVNAQTTLINFQVTEKGLEDQLLAVVVNQERPDLEAERVALLRQMNTMTIELQECEDGLLFELSNAKGDILENVTLVENLEATKKKSKEINVSMTKALKTEETIRESRKTYTDAAVRGALLFFQIDQLCKIDHMYQYSLEAFMVVHNKALAKAAQPEDKKDVRTRVANVMKSITETVFAYVARGLFERHKLIFSSLLCFAILSREDKIQRTQLDFLLRGKRKLGVERPEAVVDWISEPNWAAVQALAEVEGASPSFELLPADVSESNRWRQWAEMEKPEEEKMPTDWKNLTPFQKLLVLRCLRPDRLTSALETFVSESIGKFFVSDQAVDISVSFKDSGPTTPLFFILSPGVDPVARVEALGKKLGYTYNKKNLFNVSLGQGQEPIAHNALKTCFENGGWAMLNNIHLVANFLKELEKTLDSYSEIYTKMAAIAKRKAEKRHAKRAMLKAQAAEAAAADGEGEEKPEGEEAAEAEEKPEGEAPAATEAKPEGEDAAAAEACEEEEEEDDEEEDDDPETKLDGPKGSWDFRVFLSAEPSQIIPIGILQRSIKITSEPPTGIAANLNRALANFSDEPWEKSNKPTEYRCIMFAMCFFHAVVVERKKFGPQGWNRGYPFNVGDLTTCLEVTANYIDDRPKVPWEDLRYVFGEIMYGGHITDDWDRVLCSSYLRAWIDEKVTDSLELAPGLFVPPPMTYAEYVQYCQSDQIPPESPLLYGLHPNAEINFRTVQATTLFNTINELQPKQQAAAGGVSIEDQVRQRLTEILERMPEMHDLIALADKFGEDDRTPQQHVFYQECEYMNHLTSRVKATLKELELGLAGALSMTTAMQKLSDELYMERVPEVWAAVSFMSMRPLGSWVENYAQRNSQLLDWIPDNQTPKVTMLNYFFNPMSFLTAIMQTVSMINAFDLDQMSLVVDVLKRGADQIDNAAREGCHVYGVVMEGARWDTGTNAIEESKMKDLYPRMPVMTIRSLPNNKIDRKDQYECPLYKTQARGAGFVTALWLKTKVPPRKWTIAGVGMLLDVVE